MSAPSTLRPGYVTTSRGQLHLRWGGSGSPVVILHDAPGSSAAVETALVEALTSERTVIVPDLVGAGGTTVEDSLAGDLDIQATVLAEGLRTLGVQSVPVVGEGAGGVVAVRLAELAPDLVTAVAVRSEPVAQQHLATLPDLPAPDPSGTHLFRLFDEVRDAFAFRPWWHPSAATRRVRGLPDPGTLHTLLLDTAAHDGAHRALTQAATNRWEQGVSELPIERLAGEDVTGDAAAILAMPQGSGTVAIPPVLPSADVMRDYVTTGIGPIHLRTVGQDQPGTRPLLLLHANPGSGQGLEPLARALGASRRVIVWDTPGHGRSAPLPADDAASLSGSYAPLLVDVLDALGISECDVYGTHTGAGLATELAILAPDRVVALVLDGVPLFDDDPDLVASVMEHYFVDLTPDTHGSHIRRAWGATADMALWWPWFNHTVQGVRSTSPYAPEFLHGVVLDMLRSAPHYYRSYTAAWQWPATQRLPLLTQAVLVGSTPTDPLAAMTPRSLALLGDRATEVVFHPLGQPGSVEANAQLIATSLDGVTG
ncbi:alpha/beta fold hydrolase [Ornithinimicrobium faecis]|uniref:alpha/beta fold hydrolase n=1 Tax=Ornithinimicrobium faecis TaxID=2934158 RepID=UPI002118D97A|nr:alpha/beta hydrolase [Ornithinimicrobium sp. HY1745]